METVQNIPERQQAIDVNDASSESRATHYPSIDENFTRTFALDCDLIESFECIRLESTHSTFELEQEDVRNNLNAIFDDKIHEHELFYKPEYFVWTRKMMVSDEAHKRHTEQRRARGNDGNTTKSSDNIRTWRETPKEKSSKKLEAHRRERRREKDRIELRRAFGIDYLEVEVSKGEKKLKEQPILGLFRCCDPSPLRTCLSFLTEEEVEFEEGIQIERMLLRDNASPAVVNGEPEQDREVEDSDESKPMQQSRPALLRRSRAYDDLYSLGRFSQGEID